MLQWNQGIISGVLNAISNKCLLVGGPSSPWDVVDVYEKLGAGWGRWGTSISPANNLLPLFEQSLSAASLQAVAEAVCPETDFLVGGCWPDKAPGTFTWRPTTVAVHCPVSMEQEQPIGILMAGASWI